MFDSRSGSVAGIASGLSRRNSARRHIADLKEVAHRDAISADTPVAVKASLMRAYVDLHEIEMAMTGQGKPKPVEARNATPKRKARTVAPIFPRATSEQAPPAPAPTDPPGT